MSTPDTTKTPGTDGIPLVVPDIPVSPDRSETEMSPEHSRMVGDAVFGASPLLSSLRSRSGSLVISPWASLAAVLTEAVYYTPANISVRSITSTPASLNAIYALVPGKSQGEMPDGGLSIQRNVGVYRSSDPRSPLLDIPRAMAIGSGEAIAALYKRWERQEGAESKKLVQFAESAWIHFPDPGRIVDPSRRSAPTEEVRAVWDAEQIGVAVTEDHLHLEPDTYRAVVTVAASPERVGNLFSEDAGVYPLIVWFSGDRREHLRQPALPHAEETLGRAPLLEIVLPTFPDAGQIIDVAPEVLTEIRDHHRAGVTDVLSGYRDINRLKLAAMAAIIHGRLRVDYADWRWAGYVMCHSESLRERVRAEASPVQ